MDFERSVVAPWQPAARFSLQGAGVEMKVVEATVYLSTGGPAVHVKTMHGGKTIKDYGTAPYGGKGHAYLVDSAAKSVKTWNTKQAADRKKAADKKAASIGGV